MSGKWSSNEVVRGTVSKTINKNSGAVLSSCVQIVIKYVPSVPSSLSLSLANCSSFLFLKAQLNQDLTHLGVAIRAKPGSIGGRGTDKREGKSMNYLSGVSSIVIIHILMTCFIILPLVL